MSKGPKDRHRPGWWSPEGFLKWRSENLDAPLEAQYQRWADEWGTTRWSIKCEIRRWKGRIEGFRVRLREIDPASSVAKGLSLQDREGLETWQIDYLEALNEAEGDRRLACDIAGLSWETIRKKLSPVSADYDRALHEAVGRYDAELAERARAGVRDTLEMAYEQEDAKTLGRMSLEILERRDPANWSRHQVVGHHGVIQHEITDARMRAIKMAGEVSRGALGHHEQPALPAGSDTVDAVYVVLKEREHV